TRHARCFGGERIEPIHHRVDDFADVQEIAADRSPLATASTTRHFRCGLKQVAYQAVHRVYARGPRAGRIRRMRAMSGSAELSHHFCKLPEFLSNAFAEEDDLVECFSDRPIDPAWTDRQPGREVALSEGLQSREKLAMVETGRAECRCVGHPRLPRSSPPLRACRRPPSPPPL